MLEHIDKWLAIATVAIGALWGYFKLIAKVDRIDADQKREIAKLQESVETHEVQIDDLRENKTRNNALLETMAKSQEETRLDVKTILQSIATLAANQNKRDRDE